MNGAKADILTFEVAKLASGLKELGPIQFQRFRYPKMTIRNSIFPFVVLWCLISASTAIAQQASPKIELQSKSCEGKTTAKIAVYFSGITQLNGKPVSLQELSKTLKDKSKITEICYYREHPESSDTPPQTEQVLNAIIQERLPIAFFWDSQFQKRVSFKE